MKLSISNISWPVEQDEIVYTLMQECGLVGLEIAPTRIFSITPYNHLTKASKWAEDIKEKYGFEISSMQSIWYGKKENIFGSENERSELITYTKKAIDFAKAIGCGNLVFGCPRNRNILEGATPEDAVPFFREIANYAAEKGTVIGMEANPPIYNTNFINDTSAALQLVKKVNSPGFKLNLDVGTMIYYQENADILRGNVQLINHVHISEPELKPILARGFHNELYRLLKEENYNNFVSIEMGRNESIDELKRIICYVKGIFA